MNIDGWKYYNHAAIPSTAPHEPVNMEPINDGSIWKIGGGTAFLARWTTDWDCGYETNWWYIVCDAPFVFENLSRSSRKNIRKALENCEVKKINPTEHMEELWRVFLEATQRYKNYEMKTSKDDFCKTVLDSNANRDFWAGYDVETGKMIGYKICTVYADWVKFVASKYSTEYLKKRVSDALNYTVLDYYLNTNNKNYVSNGERSVVHETNVQDYYREHFGFRKAYCKLHIKYKPFVGFAIRIVYPFRKLIYRQNSSKFHNLVSLLSMEELARHQHRCQIKRDIDKFRWEKG